MLDKIKQQLKVKPEIYLRLKVRPGAGQSAVRQVMSDGSLKLDIAAPPAKNKANQELIRLLAAEFNVSPAMVKILSGAGEKIKLVKIIC